MTSKKEQVAIRKALLQERMAMQRVLLKPRVNAMVKTGTRLTQLFDASSTADGQHGRSMLVTTLALMLAALGKKRAGWLGVGARYLIINYPGLLRRFTKK